MKKNVIITTLVITILLSFALTINVVFAGNKNMNEDNGIQGTGKLNGKNGCRAYGGTTAVILGPENPPGFPFAVPWVIYGGACCASNTEVDTTPDGTVYYEPNQCCNPPDLGPPNSGVPGNHCECFAMRDYTPVYTPVS